ncbi:FmdB family zinc ribbon protein [Microbacterium sp. NPDC076768]|uniref:FmdB family zinc ribbon protein n=1 Tax=Microbacterium sp. NPDC076768 TaxID=3154858 RepID=UPI0034369628
MPTYAYACTSCEHKFDAVQTFADDALTVCPECGGSLRKQYGSIGVTFNGSGFYRTDSRAKSGGSTETSTSSKTESTTSAKPAAASTPASS